MSELLTPEQIDSMCGLVGYADSAEISGKVAKNTCATLAAYAEIVEAVATGDEYGMPTRYGTVCYFCGADEGGADWESKPHSPNCIWVRARQLRGKA